MAEQRVVLVTGAATGLGAQIVRSFASRGFGVVINHLFDAEADSLGEEIAGEQGADKVMTYRANVANRAQVRSMYAETIRKFGRVDILVNCAGINRDAPFMEISDESWDAVISAHLKGHFVCGQEFVNHNSDREGHHHQPGRGRGLDRQEERRQLLRRQGRSDRADEVHGA